jgi:predicted MPP superfamily phosphohydrolase
MKLQLQSDHHCEFYKNPVKFLESLEFFPNLDFLLLPGDLVVPCSQGKEKTKQILDYFSNKARHCIFVCGNHEMYHGTKEAAEGILQSVMPPNFHWLRNSSETIEGIRFFGGTMWFPDAPHNRMYEDQLNDFVVIRDFKTWVYEENRRFREAAEEHVTDETIVLTHHLPSYQAVHPAFQGDNLNRFFVCNMDNIIESMKPKFWFFGHTHKKAAIRVGDTSIISNPYGYPGENSEYQPLLLDI